MIKKIRYSVIAAITIGIVALVARSSLLKVSADASRVPVMAQVEVASPTAALGARRQQIADNQATEAALPRPPKPPQFYDPPRGPAVVVTPRRGISDIQQSPWFEQIALMNNTWFGDENGRTVVVGAGAARNDPTQGFIGVSIGSIGENNSRANAYYTPIKAGAVRITAANGTRLTLVTAEGMIFVFDYTTGQFLATPPSNYPTATPGAPLPTPTYSY